MVTINEKETTPIKMDDTLLNGTFRKDGSLATSNRTCLESADRWFLERILKNNTRNAQCTCLGKCYFPRQFLVEPEYYREHCKGFENDVKAVFFRHCTLYRLAKPADVNYSVTVSKIYGDLYIIYLDTIKII